MQHLKIKIIATIIFISMAFSISNTFAQAQGKLLRHAVIITFKTNTPGSVINAVDASFGRLAKLPMVKQFEWGNITDPKDSQHIKHIYVSTFTNQADEAAYGSSKEHQAHKKLGTEFVESVQAVDYFVN
jgi:hypothetical protein